MKKKEDEKEDEGYTAKELKNKSELMEKGYSREGTILLKGARIITMTDEGP